MTKTPDYSTWMTKQQAADTLAVSTKQIERWANDKRLQCGKWKRPEGGPAIVVYHPADIERIAQDRNPGVEAFVLPAVEGIAKVRTLANAGPKPTNGAHALAVLQPSGEQLLEALAATVSGMSQTSQTHHPVRLAERIYLTIGEAVDYTGLGSAYLRRQIAVGNLDLVKGAGPHGADVLRRKDLDKL